MVARLQIGNCAFTRSAGEPSKTKLGLCDRTKEFELIAKDQRNAYVTKNMIGGFRYAPKSFFTLKQRCISGLKGVQSQELRARARRNSNRSVNVSVGIALWLVSLATFPILSVPVHALNSASGSNSNDSLLIYAIKVIHSRPLQENVSGYGIYLGRGAVITAAHVVSRWPAFITNPKVVISGRELPARIVKRGSPETIDLALLSVNEQELPVSLRLRLNPLCKEPARISDDVIVVALQKTAKSQIALPQSLPPELRGNFNTFIRDEDIGASGSGVFHAEKKCLLGIITTRTSVMETVGTEQRTVDFKHFIPAATIAEFIPPEFRF